MVPVFNYFVFDSNCSAYSTQQSNLPAEGPLRMVALRAGFRGGTLHRPKKKVFVAKRVGFQSESMWWPKKEVFAYKSVGFRLKKTKTCHPKMVTPGAGRPLATPLPPNSDVVYMHNFLFKSIGYPILVAKSSGVKSTRKLYSSKSFVTDKKLLEVKYKVLIKKSTWVKVKK